MRLLGLILAAAFFAGCGGEEKIKSTSLATYECDFENIKPWSGASNNAYTVINMPAHSGKMISRIDSVNVYSFLFRARISDVLDKPASKIKFSAWTKTKSPNAKASIIISFNDAGGNQVFWNSEPLTFKIDEWAENSMELDIKQYSQKDNEILVYILNNGKEIVDCDDYKIEFN